MMNSCVLMVNALTKVGDVTVSPIAMMTTTNLTVSNTIVRTIHLNVPVAVCAFLITSHAMERATVKTTVMKHIVTIQLKCQ